MRIAGLDLELERLAAPLPIWHAVVDRDRWQAAAAAVAHAGGRLVALWGTDSRHREEAPLAVAAAYALRDGLAWLELPLPPLTLAYPDISRVFPGAQRMQRASADLLGIVAEGFADRRPWLDHGAWSEGRFPLRGAAAGAVIPGARAAANYPFEKASERSMSATLRWTWPMSTRGSMLTTGAYARRAIPRGAKSPAPRGAAPLSGHAGAGRRASPRPRDPHDCQIVAVS